MTETGGGDGIRCEEFMMPVLKILSDGSERKRRRTHQPCALPG